MHTPWWLAYVALTQHKANVKAAERQVEPWRTRQARRQRRRGGAK